MRRGECLAFFDYGPVRAEAAAVLPPSIMPVVILSGSDYQMGYQYGQQAGQYIEWKKDAAWVKALKEFGSRETVIHELKAFQYYTKEYTPEAIKEMEGMADGATSCGYEVSYTDILLLNTINTRTRRPTSTATYPYGANDDKLPPEGCSIWSAWGNTTTDGRLICAKSSDAEFEPQVAIVAFPDEGNHYMATAPAGELSDNPCMNDKGVFIGTSGGFANREIDFDYGVLTSCAYQHLLRFTDSASEAKDMFSSWHYPRGSNLHFSDVGGNAFVVEVTAAVKSVRKPGDFGEADFIYSTNNYFANEMKEAIRGERFIEHAGWLGRGWSISSISRNLELWNMFHNYQGKVDLEFAKMIWRVPGNQPPYPLDAKAYEATQGKGWDEKICNLDTRRIGIMLPDKGDKGVAYICTGPAGRVAYPLYPGPGDGHWYQIAGTHTFYQLALASSPAEVIEAAKKEAHASIADAYQKLMFLNYRDAGYAALNDLYSQANAEYYEGIAVYNKGLLSGGNEALRCFAQAATAFTRSQAHATQIHDVLVPPATRPEDLGLNRYGGSWAKWVNR